MRRKDRQVIGIGEMEKIISQCQACHLALWDWHGNPYALALNFGYRPGSPPPLYFHCARECKKLDLIQANPRAAFVIDRPLGKVGASLVNDQVVATNVSYGGTLKVTGAGGAFVAGDVFKLFSAGSYGGTFSQTNLFSPVHGELVMCGQLERWLCRIAEVLILASHESGNCLVGAPVRPNGHVAQTWGRQSPPGRKPPSPTTTVGSAAVPSARP